MDIYNEVKIKKENQTGKQRTHHNSQEDLIIIEKGKPIDYFVLIIEGTEYRPWTKVFFYKPNFTS